MASRALPAAADVVVVGEVRSVEGRWRAERTQIATRVRIAIARSLTGPFPFDAVVFEQLGGRVGDVTMHVRHFPRARFEAGERVVLFLDRHGEDFQARGVLRGRERVREAGLLAGRLVAGPGADARTLTCAFPGPRLWMRGERPGLDRLLELNRARRRSFAAYLAHLEARLTERGS